MAALNKKENTIFLLSVFTVFFAIFSLSYRASAQEDLPIGNMLIAVHSGDIEEVKQLLTQGVDVNVRSKRGWTPLHWATKYGNREIVDLLLANGADVNAETDINQLTPLHYAAIENHQAMAELLVLNGAN